MVDNGSDGGVLAGMNALSLFETLFARDLFSRSSYGSQRI
jgi:hypothetical protein